MRDLHPILNVECALAERAREAGTPRSGVAREARGSGPSAHDVARSAIKNELAKATKLYANKKFASRAPRAKKNKQEKQLS